MHSIVSELPNANTTRCNEGHWDIRSLKSVGWNNEENASKDVSELCHMPTRKLVKFHIPGSRVAPSLHLTKPISPVSSNIVKFSSLSSRSSGRVAG